MSALENVPLQLDLFWARLLVCGVFLGSDAAFLK